jgi:hypothetical protein
VFDTRPWLPGKPSAKASCRDARHWSLPSCLRLDDPNLQVQLRSQLSNSRAPMLSKHRYPTQLLLADLCPSWWVFGGTTCGIQSSTHRNQSHSHDASLRRSGCDHKGRFSFDFSLSINQAHFEPLTSTVQSKWVGCTSTFPCPFPFPSAAGVKQDTEFSRNIVIRPSSAKHCAVLMLFSPSLRADDTKIKIWV